MVVLKEETIELKIKPSLWGVMPNLYMKSVLCW